ncbi:lipoprotein [Microbulbifer sp. SSSA002]|uniref:LPS translocon maturation chaperone LptM n=1 Tax=unclassified Microbulbifer TaxID=2619833 RepID=UPI00403A2FAD
MLKRLSLLSIAISATALLLGCGQKGPLYLPQDPAMPASNIPGGPPQTTPTSPAAQPGEPGSAAEQALETVDEIESEDGYESDFDIDNTIESGPTIEVDDESGTADDSNVEEDLAE